MEYTQEQLNNILKFYPSVEEMKKQTAIRNARKYLEDTDYVIIKIQEYAITGETVDNDYTEILEKREEARNIIRQLEV